MTDANRIKDVEETYNEAYQGQSGMLDQMEEADKFYLGGINQWSSEDVAQLKAEDRPIVSINRIQKAINMVLGYNRQNKMDLKFFPVEGSDQETGDIYTEVSKWIMTNCNGNENSAYTFGDNVRGGLGWLTLNMDYTTDPLYGDIKVNFGDKYHTLFDPYSKDPAQEDWDYILRYAWPSKEVAASIYPKRAKAIKRMKTGDASKFTVQSPMGLYDRNTRVNIVEKWYKIWETKTIIIDPFTFESYEWKGGEKKLNQLKEQRPELMNRVAIVKAKDYRIKLITEMEGRELLHDGRPPKGFSERHYSFIPSFCYYLPNFNDWTYKVFGVINPMIDPQREYNKFRSVMTDAVMSVPSSGWIYEKNAVTDPNELNKTGPVKIEVARGKGLKDGLWAVPPAQISSTLTQLHQYHEQDMTAIGPNPDLLGIVGQGGSGADAPGVSLNLRQKQGMLTLQNPFDGQALAFRLLGRRMIELINRWPDEKIQRIIGRPVPPQFQQVKNKAKYDCIVDQQSSSPTYRMTNYIQLQQQIQHGAKIPPEVMREAMDLPAKTKQIWAQSEAKQMQQAMQQRQQEHQIEMKKLEIMASSPVKEKQLDIKGDLMLEDKKQEGRVELEEMDNMAKLAIEKLKGKKAS